MLCRIRWIGTHISQGTASSIFRAEKSGLLFYPRPRLEVLTKCLCLFTKLYCVTQHCNLHIYCNKNLKFHTNLACTNSDQITCWLTSLTPHTVALSLMWSLLGSAWNGQGALHLSKIFTVWS